MEDTNKQQLEALEVMYDYNKKLKSAIQNVVIELQTERKEDTDAYLDLILKGINWVLQVANGTWDLIQKNDKSLDKESINEHIIVVNQAVSSKDDSMLAQVLETKVLPLLNQFDAVAMKVAKIQEN